MRSEQKVVYCQILGGNCIKTNQGECGNQRQGLLKHLLPKIPCPVALEFLNSRRNLILKKQLGSASSRPTNDPEEITIDFSEPVELIDQIASIAVISGTIYANDVGVNAYRGTEDLSEDSAELVLHGEAPDPPKLTGFQN